MNTPSSCPVDGLLHILPDRWSFLIVRDLFYGIRRFDALQIHLGISKKTLAARLKQLEATHILQRIPYQQRPLRHEYRLSAKGQALFPVIIAMANWGNRWLDHAPSLQLYHAPCKQPIEAPWLCHHCGQPITPARVTIKAGPGAKTEEILALQRAKHQSGAS